MTGRDVLEIVGPTELLLVVSGFSAVWPDWRWS